MEWLMQLQGQIIGLDTAPLIYFQGLTQMNRNSPPNPQFWGSKKIKVPQNWGI